MSSSVGIIALARPTFDVEFAREKLDAMLGLLDRSGTQPSGPRELLMDGEAARAALDAHLQAGVETILVLQVTFTDAAMISEIGHRHGGPLAIWSVPEPRLGGRLRLNSFCGLNLAGHALGLRGREFSYLHADPGDAGTFDAVRELLAGGMRAVPVETRSNGHEAKAEARGIAESLKGLRIGCIGEHPAGFDTCAYDKNNLRNLAGVEVDEISLGILFDQARSAPIQAVSEARSAASASLSGLDEVDQAQLDRSLALKSALDLLRRDGRYDAFAVRCWPETFTEYGGAVCGPVSMLGEARVPCACEADVYGAVSQLILQAVADAPVFLTDLVDMDVADNSAVVWHCGQAPVSMANAGEKPSATIHSNRKMPLLYEFALKPGRVTFMRVSQARGRHSMVVGGGEMLARPKSFTGTSGVVRFDGGTGPVLDRIIGAGLEHHMAIAYGDHRPMLEQVAAALGLPVLEL